MNRCPRCMAPTPDCFCARIPRVFTRTRWLVLRHFLESGKPSNTGRLASLALGCPLIDLYAPDRAAGDWSGVRPGRSKEPGSPETGAQCPGSVPRRASALGTPGFSSRAEWALILEGAWLLFPEGPARDPAPRPAHVVVVDATWPQARRMVHRHPELARLPRLTLPVPARPLPRLRASPRADRMSTLEAVAAAVELLEGEESARPLRRLQEEVVARGRLYRRSPSL